MNLMSKTVLSSKFAVLQNKSERLIPRWKRYDDWQIILSNCLLSCWPFLVKPKFIEDIIARLQSFNYFFAPLLILYLVSVLERTLDKFGFIHWIEDYLETRNLNRLSYAAIPGLIGLIPSIGGAHFACSIFPVSARKKLSGCRLAAIN